MQLTQEQKYVIQEISKFKKDIQTLSGHPGTGKSEVVRHLSMIHKDFAVCAYTGKAVEVLRRKKIEAQTIHSLIYVLLRGADGEPILDENDNPVFVLNPTLGHQGIIIDEGSMVSHDIFNDLVSFKIPLIFVGDHGQLEPVNSDFNLMQDPDFKIEQIHRNAGEIAHFCAFIRSGKRPAAFEHQYACKKIKFISKYDVDKHFDDVDQIVCAYNKTRVEINVRYREAQGLPVDWPVVGDSLMCLKNNKKIGLFNGMQGTVVSVGKKGKSSKLTFDYNGTLYRVHFDPKHLNSEKYNIEFGKESNEAFDFCKCCTCHKVQGSEWDSGMVLEQECKGWSHTRWCNTAASRFREKLYWAS